MSTPTDFGEALDASIVLGFLYGIQSETLSQEEVAHRVAGFRHTKGYAEAIKHAKQTFDKHVIGEGYIAPGEVERRKQLGEDEYYRQVGFNQHLVQARQSLWGDKPHDRQH